MSIADAPADEWFYVQNGAKAGPVTRSAMDEIIRSAKIDRSTIVWRSGMSDWKPLGETELWTAVATSPMPPPIPVAQVSDTMAWIIVAVPLAGLFIDKIIGPSFPWFNDIAILVYFVVYTLLILRDAKTIKDSGRVPGNIGLSAWFWLVPVYLYKRSKALGRSQLHMWSWFATVFCTILISTDGLTLPIYWGVGVPPCDSAYSRSEVIKLFDSIPLVKTSGASAVSIANATETASTSSTNSCKARVGLSNGNSVGVNYTIETREGKIYYRVNIAD
jgi:hypothetical protein